MSKATEDVSKKIFEFAYEMAMRDATLRTSVLRRINSNSSESENKSKIKLLSEYDDAKVIVRKYIDSIINGNEIPCFYSVEQDVEAKLSNYVKEQKWCDQATFTFGNTQKLINMTAKYMFISCYQNPTLRENFRKCHCPMDNIIIQVIIEKICNSDEEQRVKELAKTFMAEDGEYSQRRTWQGYLKQSWSNIIITKKGQYMFFQQLVKELGEKENLSPLEYDLCYWGAEGEA